MSDLREWWRSTSRLELVATLVMSMAAIATAWTGFQSSKWSGEQTKEFSRAAADRTESVRFDNLASDARMIDISVYVAWLEAVNADVATGALDSIEAAVEPDARTLSGFIRARAREEFRPAFEAWIAAYAADRDNAPATPFVMPEYVLADADAAIRHADAAEDAYLEATEHGETADRYVFTTVVFALAIFFSGISSKLEVLKNRRLAVALALAMTVVGLVSVVSLPIHSLIG